MDPDMDGYEEWFNPYSGTCPVHGAWKGAYDECPKCLHADDLKRMTDFPNSICWGCDHCQDEPGRKADCGYYDFPQTPRKKRCKYFKPLEFHQDYFGEGED